jgi:hypothetical protein
MSLLKAILLALQVTDKLVTWLRERQLISAGRAQQLAENLERSHACVSKAMEARRNVGANDPNADDPYRRD